MKKRLILGDIHGHFEHVKEIYDREQPDIVICLGDYVDSFDRGPEDHEKCLNDLIALRKDHIARHGKGTFRMLLGNHDFHYIMDGEQYSGYNIATKNLVEPIIRKCLDDNIIEIAYIDEINKSIYTHAGLSQTWFDQWLQGSLGNIHTVTLDAFRFTYGNRFDSTGDNKFSSPIWIRPYSLGSDMWHDSDGVEWRQVVGHTHSKGIIDFSGPETFTSYIEHPNFIMCDCLPFDYLVENLDDNGKMEDYIVVHYKQFNEEYLQ